MFLRQQCLDVHATTGALSRGGPIVNVPLVYKVSGGNEEDISPRQLFCIVSSATQSQVMSVPLVHFTRRQLEHYLEHMSRYVQQAFNGRVVQLVVHGGACMLLNSRLFALESDANLSTDDVDFMLTPFVMECAYKFNSTDQEALQRLASCVQRTAKDLNLEPGWMNSNAEKWIPIYHNEKGEACNQVYFQSLERANLNVNTLFISSNKSLVLIGIPSAWSVALKLERFSDRDRWTAATVLREQEMLNRTRWDAKNLMKWLATRCTALYQYKSDIEMMTLKERCQDVIRILHAPQVPRLLELKENSKRAALSYSPLTKDSEHLTSTTRRK